MTKTGYNVYYAPEGGPEEFLGEVESLAEAYELEGGQSLPSAMWDTARAAGHVDGMSAPDQTGEADEPAEWFGADSCYCAVKFTR
jgi:hypothetical protein